VEVRKKPQPLAGVERDALRREKFRAGKRGVFLVLVPEINLTPQLEARVQSALPGVRTATLHSGLAAGVRRANWDRAASGDAQIVRDEDDRKPEPLTQVRK